MLVEDDTSIEPYEPDPQPSSSGLSGLDCMPLSGSNIMIKVDDMYENGNKIGAMCDINMQVWIMD